MIRSIATLLSDNSINVTLEIPLMEKNTISYLLTADSVIKDEYTKKTSCLGIFEILNIAPGETKLLYAFVVVGKILLVEAGTVKIIVSILNPQGGLFKTSELNGNVNIGDLDVFAFFPFTEFTERGRYLIKISLNGIELKDEGKFYFDVK
jgi:hypothetical protein